uniref:Uncharacterized protein n=1 Tax=Arundo donax TaxID=35708 RepID=A0A0A9FRF8_ARUDO
MTGPEGTGGTGTVQDMFLFLNFLWICVCLYVIPGVQIFI